MRSARTGRCSGLGPDWVGVAVRTPAGVRLDVYHPAGATEWVDAAVAYWEGRLAGLERIASSRFAVVHRGRVGPGGPLCFFKRFLLRGWSDWCKHWARPSRGRRALLHAQEIRRLGFDSPRPLCLVEERHGLGVGQSALVTEAVEGVRSLRETVDETVADGMASLTERRRLLRAFGRAIGAWHAAGLYHGDMSPRNILCRRDGSQVECVWIDNEGTRRFGRLPMRLRVRNLVQVNKRLHGLTRTDRLRLSAGYFEEVRLPPSVRKQVLRRVWQRSIPSRRRPGRAARQES